MCQDQPAVGTSEIGLAEGCLIPGADLRCTMVFVFKPSLSHGFLFGIKQDPIPAMARRLVDSGVATADDLRDLEAAAAAQLDDAFAFVRAAAYDAPEAALDKVFV